MAENLNNFYCRFNQHDHSTEREELTSDLAVMSLTKAIRELQSGEVELTLKRINPNKAPGPDQTCGRLLKHFNTVQPHLMGQKLLQMNINPHLILWVLAFLTGRHQVVRINGQSSSTRSISTGAPQGSVISPVLFTLYTDNCRSSDPEIIYIKYSDNTVIIDTSNTREAPS
ncbi:hypothetical protein SKAU_G00412910 [Synaphobranchus kaupii]|uniref:Reverse transcriptase domain-containing protein n=1 Tax=Synaphobranchus kaupii TaxID=118154 RepID=A0A9Q1E833_SYNKA|nr:hypothetical protein SKAU_G00412910 [Synaphobranchus kaupii]